jgi:hypothetical protein
MDSLCFAKHYVIDTRWFHWVYLAFFVILMAHKQRLITIVSSICLLFLIWNIIKKCTLSLSAFIKIGFGNLIMIISSVIILLILSVFDFGNIYITYAVNALAIIVYEIYGFPLTFDLFFKVQSVFM